MALSYVQGRPRVLETPREPHRFSARSTSSPVSGGIECSERKTLGWCFPAITEKQGGRMEALQARPDTKHRFLSSPWICHRVPLFLHYEHREVACVSLNKCTFSYCCQGLHFIPPIDVQLSCFSRVLISCFRVVLGSRNFCSRHFLFGAEDAAAIRN